MNLKYLINGDESQCCGCSACAVSCPKNAIEMQPNREGFLYPVINKDCCIDCGICKQVCPEMVMPAREMPQEIYAVQNKACMELSKSSSGGVFRLLADKVIQSGGYVVGCVWNRKMEPVLTVASTLEELEPMQGSKYLSSLAGSAYADTKKLLLDGKSVLFTGTPCQCAGLLNYLKKPYDNLLTMEFLCHGIPSQMAFDAFRQYLEKQKRGTIVAYSFRDKEKYGWSHSESFAVERKGNVRKYWVDGSVNSYLYGFLNGYLNRYSCYTCNFRGLERYTDFTVCDFWGYQNHHKELSAYEGISALQINSQKGKAFFESVKGNALFHPTKREHVAEENPAILLADKEEVPLIRKSIYGWIQDVGWAQVAEKHLRCKHFYLKKMWYALPKWIRESVRKIVRG